MKKTLLIILLALAGSYGKMTAQTPAVIMSDKTGWHKIGERTVDFARDRDEIMVIGADRFSAIKFIVTDAPIDLIDLEVYYESGDKQNINVRTPVLAGKESRVIDLNGGERSLSKIVFVYKTLANQKADKANVEVWGLKTNASINSSNNKVTGETQTATTGKSTIPSPTVVMSDKTGWHNLGSRTVDFSKDRDEILVIGADRFSSIKFTVTGAAIDLQDLEVYYESGDKQDIQVRTPILAGKESRVIDLKGGERSLKKIVFIYKTLPNQKDEKASVEVWGLKTNTN
jgi:hypothetical protein